MEKKMYLEMLEDNVWSETSSDGEFFLFKKIWKGNSIARWALNHKDFEGNQLCKIGLKMKVIFL